MNRPAKEKEALGEGAGITTRGGVGYNHAQNATKHKPRAPTLENSMEKKRGGPGGGGEVGVAPRGTGPRKRKRRKWRLAKL